MDSLKILAGINFFFGLFSIVVFIKLGVFHYFFWLCNHQSFIYAIAIWGRSARWLSAELSIALIPQLLWCLDFVSYLVFGRFIWGITEYMFLEDYAFSTYLVSLQHFVLVPLALYALCKIGRPSLRDWRLSLVHLSVLAVITVLFTASQYNVNCVFENACVPYLPKTVFLWPVVWSGMVIMMTWITNRFLFFLYQNSKAKLQQQLENL